MTLTTFSFLKIFKGSCSHCLWKHACQIWSPYLLPFWRYWHLTLKNLWVMWPWPRPLIEKKLRGHVRTVPGKFEVCSCKRFEANYRSQFNDVVIIVASRLRYCAHTERQNRVKTLYPPSAAKFTALYLAGFVRNWEQYDTVSKIVLESGALLALPWRPF